MLLMGMSVSLQAQNRLAYDNQPQPKIVRFYPNPANAVINFDLQSANTGLSLFIFNFMGKKVFEMKNITAHSTINLDEFYRGIYVFQLRDKNGAVLESGKFQVAK
jgi:hypothetical protein